MGSGARYILLAATRTRAWLAPVAACVFVVAGVYAYPSNEASESWGATALLGLGLSAWLVGALLTVETPVQAEMATVALGGPRRRWWVELALVLLVATALSTVFVAYPMVLGQFAPPARAPELAVSVVAHLCCAVVGGAIAVLFSTPRIAGRATSVVATMAFLLVLVVVAAPLGHLGGPVAISSAMVDAPRGTSTGA
jgi:hypothetical protein